MMRTVCSGTAVLGSEGTSPRVFTTSYLMKMSNGNENHGCTAVNPSLKVSLKV